MRAVFNSGSQRSPKFVVYEIDSAEYRDSGSLSNESKQVTFWRNGEKAVAEFSADTEAREAFTNSWLHGYLDLRNAKAIGRVTT